MRPPGDVRWPCRAKAEYKEAARTVARGLLRSLVSYGEGSYGEWTDFAGLC